MFSLIVLFKLLVSNDFIQSLTNQCFPLFYLSSYSRVLYSTSSLETTLSVWTVVVFSSCLFYPRVHQIICTDNRVSWVSYDGSFPEVY